LVGSHCGSELIHTTQFRAKSVDSFERKCYKFEPNGRRRYANPLVEITDLAGVRIIVFVKESVNTICSEIKTLLHVKEIEDIGERVYSGGKFGYQSTHLLVTLGVDRRNLIENKKYKDMVCEIQVRTILQHAWAEMEHDIQYKSEQEIPLDLKKRFSALAGLLEIADREFQAIQKDQ
jgi:ppGpp synthetase/RelA/SpoT-type nucleotidyltranferase